MYEHEFLLQAWKAKMHMNEYCLFLIRHPKWIIFKNSKKLMVQMYTNTQTVSLLTTANL